MIPGRFDYHAPTSVDEALTLLGDLDGAKPLAGGHSLVPAMRMRLANPEILVDLNGIAELSYIREEDDQLRIGAMTRESEIERSPLVEGRFAMLADASRVVADPLVRNRGTIGGNLAHADPANDHPAVMRAYGATLVARGPDGEREISADDFFVDLFTSDLEPGELLTEIRIPIPGPNDGGAYVKFERKVGDYAITAAAVQLTMDGETCSSIRAALTNVGAVPIRPTEAEEILTGSALTDEALEEASKAAAAASDPTADLRGSVEYKRDMTRVLFKRAVRKAAKRAVRKAAERAKGGAA